MQYDSYLFGDSHSLSLGQDINKYNVYNFSVGRDSYFDIERKIKFLLEKQKIKTIYLSVDDHNLSPYRETANNMTKSEFYCRQRDYNSTLEYFYNQYFKRYFVLFNPEINVALRNFIKNIFRNDKVELKNENWCSLPLSKRVIESNKRFRDQFSSGNKSQTLTLSLLRIVEICKTHRINLIGIKFPLAKEYLQVIGHKSYRADSVLLRKNIPVLDFKEGIITDCSDFLNQDHLNYKGAQKLIKVIFKNKVEN